jgi:hypothetical protein
MLWESAADLNLFLNWQLLLNSFIPLYRSLFVFLLLFITSSLILFQIVPPSIPEMSAGFMSSTVPLIPIYITWILYPLQFCSFPLI